jgi:hypothetical protein
MLMYKKVASLAILGVLGAAQPLLAQEPNSSQSLSIPSTQVKYKDLGGPQLGTVWGDSAKGAHGSFLRLPKGFVSPAHLHTGDYYGVIVGRLSDQCRSRTAGSGALARIVLLPEGQG